MMVVDASDATGSDQVKGETPKSEESMKDGDMRQLYTERDVSELREMCRRTTASVAAVSEALSDEEAVREQHLQKIDHLQGMVRHLLSSTSALRVTSEQTQSDTLPTKLRQLGSWFQTKMDGHSVQVSDKVGDLERNQVKHSLSKYESAASTEGAQREKEQLLARHQKMKLQQAQKSMGRAKISAQRTTQEAAGVPSTSQRDPKVERSTADSSRRASSSEGDYDDSVCLIVKLTRSSGEIVSFDVSTSQSCREAVEALVHTLKDDPSSKSEFTTDVQKALVKRLEQDDEDCDEYPALVTLHLADLSPGSDDATEKVEFESGLRQSQET